MYLGTSHLRASMVRRILSRPSNACKPGSIAGPDSVAASGPELLECLLLADPTVVEASLAVDVMGGVAAPECRVASQPAVRVALAHLDQLGYEHRIEQQEGQQLTPRPGAPAEGTRNDGIVEVAESPQAAVAALEHRLGEAPDFAAATRRDQRVGNRPVGSVAARDPVGARRMRGARARVL